MRIIIEHLRAGTVPHDMIEELLRAGIRFYEGKGNWYSRITYELCPC